MTTCNVATLLNQQESELSVFDWVDTRHQMLMDIYRMLTSGIDRIQISHYLQLACQIQHACENHKDGVLAALQLNRNPKHQYIKELFAGVLCELLGKESGLNPTARLRLICAALTQDIAMMELQDNTLDHQGTPLTRDQQQFVEKHPRASKKMLMEAGVTDRIWLEAVEEHHERLDGSGYPAGLTADKISPAAKILATVDLYTAMVRPRGDRPVRTPKQAMKKVFLIRGELIDIVLSKRLIGILGIHPPGSWVKLAKGEVGVVVGAGAEMAFPQVSTFIAADGQPQVEHQVRDTSIAENTIVETLEAPFHFNMSSILKQLWPKIPAASMAELKLKPELKDRSDSCGIQNWTLLPN